VNIGLVEVILLAA